MVMRTRVRKLIEKPTRIVAICHYMSPVMHGVLATACTHMVMGAPITNHLQSGQSVCGLASCYNSLCGQVCLDPNR